MHPSFEVLREKEIHSGRDRWRGERKMHKETKSREGE
jgi:hypothetical protein